MVKAGKSIEVLFKMYKQETSSMVQWLRFSLPMQEVWVQSLVRKLRSHMPLGQKTKACNRNNKVTNSIMTFKMVHIETKS